MQKKTEAELAIEKLEKEKLESEAIVKTAEKDLKTAQVALEGATFDSREHIIAQKNVAEKVKKLALAKKKKKVAESKYTKAVTKEAEKQRIANDAAALKAAVNLRKANNKRPTTPPIYDVQQVGSSN